MYGDTTTMRKRAAQLREQGVDLRSLADQLVSQADSIAWTGRAADAMRRRMRDRAMALRGCAADHETAAEALGKHLTEVGHLKETVTVLERKARTITDERSLAAFTPPPTGHKDWLSVDLPGLR